MKTNTLHVIDSEAFLKKILEQIKSNITFSITPSERQSSSVAFDSLINPNFDQLTDEHYILSNSGFQTYTLEILNIETNKLDFSDFTECSLYIESINLTNVSTDLLSLPSNIKCDIDLLPKTTETLTVFSPPDADVIQIRLHENQGKTPRLLRLSNPFTRNTQDIPTTSLISISNSICPCTISGFHHGITYMGRSHWVECISAKLSTIHFDSNFAEPIHFRSFTQFWNILNKNTPPTKILPASIVGLVHSYQYMVKVLDCEISNITQGDALVSSFESLASKIGTIIFNCAPKDILLRGGSYGELSFRYKSTLLPGSESLMIDSHNAHRDIEVKFLDISGVSFDNISIFRGSFGKFVISVHNNMTDFRICLSTFISLDMQIQDFKLIKNFLIDSNRVENLFTFSLDTKPSEFKNFELDKIILFRKSINSLKISIMGASSAETRDNLLDLDHKLRFQQARRQFQVRDLPIFLYGIFGASGSSWTIPLNYYFLIAFCFFNIQLFVLVYITSFDHASLSEFDCYSTFQFMKSMFAGMLPFLVRSSSECALPFVFSNIHALFSILLLFLFVLGFRRAARLSSE